MASVMNRKKRRRYNDVEDVERNERQMQLITEYICNHLGESVDNIKSKSRKHEYLFPRHLCIYFIHASMYPSVTWKEIGDFFGNRDHSTIMSSIQETVNLISSRSMFIYPYYKELNKDIMVDMSYMNLLDPYSHSALNLAAV